MVFIERQAQVVANKDHVAGAPAMKKILKRIEEKGINWLVETDSGHEFIQWFFGNVFEHASTRMFEWKGLENLSEIRRYPHFNKTAIITHKSHSDGIPGASVGLKLRDIINQGLDEGEGVNRIVYTMTGSMKHKQGPLIAAFLNYAAEPFFKKHNITPDYVVSQNDIDSREMEAPEDNGALTKEGIADAHTLSLVHGEGLTKSEKVNHETGKTYGLQPLDRKFRGVLSNQFRNFKRGEGVGNLIIPVAIEGTEKLFHPDSKKIEAKVVQQLVEMLTIGDGTWIGNAVNATLSLWLGIPVSSEKVGVIHFGMPKTLEDLHPNGTFPVEFGDNIMREVAKVSSPHYLGDYGRRLLGQAA